MVQKISFASLIGTVLLFLVHNNILKINWEPQPPNKPDVVVVVPDEIDPVVPVVPPKPQPAPDVDEIDYPDVPAGFEEVSADIYKKFMECKNQKAAFAFAKNYETFATTESVLTDAITNTDLLVEYNNGILKDILSKNNLKKDFCVGLAPAIEKVMYSKIGEKTRKLSKDPDEKILRDTFMAISAQSYKAYNDLVKGS